MLLRHTLRFVLTFMLAAWAGNTRAEDKAAGGSGLGNPVFVCTVESREAAQRIPAELLKQLGYDGCAHFGLDGLEERLQALDAAGMRLFQVCLRVNLAEGQEPYDARLKALLPLLKGRDTMLALMIDGGKPSEPADAARAAELAGEIADLAWAQEVRVALCPHSGHGLQRMDDALRVIDMAKRPSLGVMFHLGQTLKVEDAAAIPALLAKARPHLYAVSIHGGSADGAALLRTLRDLGYTGPVGLQGQSSPGDAREELARPIAAWRALSRELYADEAGFTPLFNGKDLTGWAGEAEWWSVQDGCLTAQSTAAHPCKKQSYLMYRAAQPSDYDLRLEWRLNGGNSGIQIRSRELPGWDTRGYQADMDEANVYTGSLYEHMRLEIALLGQQTTFAPDGKKTVAMFGQPAELKKIIRQHEWNEYRIVCYGNEITLYINGVMTARTCDDQQALAARQGVIALQNHPGPPMKAQFRKIRMKEFKPAVAALEKK